MEPLKKVIQNKVDDSMVRTISGQTSAYQSLLKTNARIFRPRTADIKLCCYLKMSMNTKVLQRVTGLSVRYL